MCNVLFNLQKEEAINSFENDDENIDKPQTDFGGGLC